MTENKNYINKLLNKLSHFNKAKSKRDIFTEFLRVIALLIIVVFCFTLLESIFYLSPQAKIVLVISILLILVFALIYFLKQPLTNLINSNKPKHLEFAADEIGHEIPVIKDNLLNVIQVIKIKDYYSKDLTNAAFENIYNQVKEFNFQSIIDYSLLKKTIYISSSLLIIFTLLIFSTSLSHGFKRLANLKTVYEKPAEFTLTVLSGSKRIKKGESINLKVLGKGKVPSDITFYTRAVNEAEYVTKRIKVDSSNTFSLRLHNLKYSIEYFAEKNDVQTDIHIIKIITPPTIGSINYEIIPPRYSKLPAINQTENGNISALKGTKVNFDFEVSDELISAIRKSENKSDTLQVSERRVNGSFYVLGNDKYEFRILDIEKNENEHPIKYLVNVLPDQFPNIEITRPENISLVPTNDIVSINYKISDDYGISKVKLGYSISTSQQIEDNDKFILIDLQFNKNEIDQSQYYNWDVSTLGLRENDIVDYYLEVFDNDNISGPKSTKSQLYKLKVPTLDELFAQAENTQDMAVKDLTETLKEAEELQNEFKEIQDELKQNEKKIDWTEKERLEDSMQKFEELTEKINNVQKQLEKMRQEMAENNLLSEETMEKYNELQDLMDELSNEDMMKALKDMQKSLEDLMRDKVQKSLDDLAFNEDMFQKSIERTLNLLKNIQIEQKVDEIIKRTEKLAEDLDKQSKETKQNSKENNQTKSNELAENQKDIKEQLDNLEEEMKKLYEKMMKAKNMPSEKMDQMNKEFGEQKNQELSEEAEKNLQENNPFDALKSQQQLSQNMNSMMQKMQKMQEDMQSQSQQMVMQNMLKAIDNIINLSKQQETLSQNTSSISSDPQRMPTLAQPQQDLKQSLDRILKQLSDLSQNTFAITPEMGEALGKARNNMANAVDGLQGKNKQKSSFNQGDAMGNLNEAANLLQKSLMAMMHGDGQGGGGMMSLMQQLQQMAQQQMGINKITQMIKQGQLSMQQQAQLQRLAQQQGAVQKSLQELSNEAREAGQSKKLSTNLEKILVEMKEVVAGINTRKIDDDLINKQEKILSKLLDAQQSINERDFEKNRESLTGKDFNLNSPTELILSDQAQDLLREELLKSIQEGYSKDYQDLIKRYFESLEKIESQN